MSSSYQRVFLTGLSARSRTYSRALNSRCRRYWCRYCGLRGSRRLYSIWRLPQWVQSRNARHCSTCTHYLSRWSAGCWVGSGGRCLRLIFFNSCGGGFLSSSGTQCRQSRSNFRCYLRRSNLFGSQTFHHYYAAPYGRPSRCRSCRCPRPPRYRRGYSYRRRSDYGPSFRIRHFGCRSHHRWWSSCLSEFYQWVTSAYCGVLHAARSRVSSPPSFYPSYSSHPPSLTPSGPCFWRVRHY